jgi:hypothetical protein
MVGMDVVQRMNRVEQLAVAAMEARTQRYRRRGHALMATAVAPCDSNDTKDFEQADVHRRHHDDGECCGEHNGQDLDDDHTIAPSLVQRFYRITRCSQPARSWLREAGRVGTGAHILIVLDPNVEVLGLA